MSKPLTAAVAKYRPGPKRRMIKGATPALHIF